MFKTTLGLAFALVLPFSAACNSPTINGGDTDGGAGDDGGTGPCVGRGCQINYSCPTTSGPTTLTGVVSIPAGNLPLNNAKVYIPSGDVPPAPVSGASCDRCDTVIPSDAVASTTTDINGKFTLTNVPSGTNIPLVIRVGKWRRVVTIPSITDCTSTQLDTTMTRLPRNKTEGSIPKIAVTTGNADAMECIFRKNKLGLDDSEFTLPSGNGSVNLFAGSPYQNPNNGAISYGANKYKANFNGNAAAQSFPDISTLWSPSGGTINSYDIVAFSCEGQQNAGLKPAAAHTALQSYIDAGGRVFASHWHNVWISDATNEVKSIATFGNFYQNDTTTITANINQSFSKAKSLADWLILPSVNGSTQYGKLDIKFSRQTLATRDTAKTKDWVNFQPPGLNNQSQYFSFNAPLNAAESQQCGQMVFTDIHVSGDPNGDSSVSTTGFPDGCKTTALTPQEKALIFMLFDLTNCLQPGIG